MLGHTGHLKKHYYCTWRYPVTFIFLVVLISYFSSGSKWKPSVFSASLTPCPTKFATVATGEPHPWRHYGDTFVRCVHACRTVHRPENEQAWKGFLFSSLSLLLEEPRNALTLRSKLVFLPRRTPTRRRELTDCSRINSLLLQLLRGGIQSIVPFDSFEKPAGWTYYV